MKKVLAGFIIGAILTATAMYFLSNSKTIVTGDSQEPKDEKKPLYWVAPMDPNYRRDKPGKSPMGMDLVPFYGDNEQTEEENPGTVKISPDVENNLGVKTEKVTKRRLNQSFSAVAYVRFNENELTHVHSKISGWVEKLYVKSTGENIAKGQPLYEIYAPEFVNAQEELLLAVKQNNKNFINSTIKKLESMQIPLQVINQIIKQNKVQRTVLFQSQHDGIIENLEIREGYFVKPEMTILSIANLDRVWIEASVLQTNLHKLSVGMAAEIKFESMEERYTSTVDYIYPQIDEKTRLVRVRLLLNNESQLLKPNMYAKVYFDYLDDKEMLTISNQSIIRTGQSNRVVLAFGNGKYKSANVVIGESDSEFTQILSGLKDGERVVTSAQFLLDSESSKTSDFMRMYHKMLDEKDLPEATVKGVINSINSDTNMINITREAIPEWKRPAATLDFNVDDRVSYERFRKGDEVLFTFRIYKGEFIITQMTKL